MKNLLSLFLVLLFCSMVTAQNEEDELQPTRAGFKTGFNLANLTGDVENTSLRVRLHFGAAIEFPVTQEFSVQPEIIYSAQGAKFDIGDEEIKTNLDYLNVPILAKYYVFDGFSIEAGPQFGLLAVASSSNLAEEDEDEFFNSINSFDFSFDIGASYHITQNIFLSARYNFGLTDVDDVPDVDVKANNSVFQFSIGYFFKTVNTNKDEDQQ